MAILSISKPVSLTNRFQTDELQLLIKMVKKRDRHVSKAILELSPLDDFG